jgi:hypothetical protein
MKPRAINKKDPVEPSGTGDGGLKGLSDVPRPPGIYCVGIIKLVVSSDKSIIILSI